MKTIYLIFFLIIPINLLAQDDLYNKIKLDKDFIAYKQVEYSIKDGLLSKRFVIPKNFASLAIQNGKQVDEAALIKSLEMEGMVNATEYIDLVKKQNLYMMKTMQKYPELLKLEPTERKKLLMRLLSSK